MAGSPTDMYDTIAICNVDNEAFTFFVDKRPYTLQIGEIRYFPRFIANYGVRGLIDRICNKKDQKGKLIRDMEYRDQLASKIVIDEKPLASPVTKTQAEINDEMVAQLNTRSDLDAVLKKRKEDLKGGEAVLPAPKSMVEQAAPPITQPDKLIPLPDPVINPVDAPQPDPAAPLAPQASSPKEEFAGLKNPKVLATNEDGPTKIEASITDDEMAAPEVDMTDQPDAPVVDKPATVPDRDTLISYAKNSLKLDVTDSEFLKKIDPMSDAELAAELQYEEE